MRNKKKRLPIRRVVFMIALAVLTAGTAGGTLTYLTDNEQTQNRLTAGDNVIEVDEDFEETDPGPVEDFRKAIRVRNTGQGECWRRRFGRNARKFDAELSSQRHLALHECRAVFLVSVRAGHCGGCGSP